MEPKTKNVVLATFAVVAIAFAAWWMYRPAKGTVRIPDTFPASVICLQCKAENAITYRKGEPAPYKCPSCDQVSAYPWWYCSDCRYRFIPELVKKGDGPPRPTPFPACAHCNCLSVSGWNRDNPEQAPAGDAKLPKFDGNGKR